jgi:hypothetical protein
VREELEEKRKQLQNRMKACHDQGQDPAIVPLSLTQGRDILDLVIKALDELSCDQHEHIHTYKVGGHDKVTSGAR